MQTLTKTALVLLFLLIFSHRAAAQTPAPSFEDMRRQMLEMQRKMFEQLQNFSFDTPNFTKDTTFFFHFDTTFDGGSISHFFHFSPFKNDSIRQQKDFFDFDSWLDQFFNLDGQFEQPDYGIRDFPKDDGGQPQNEDNLLPEERLRKQEEAEKSGKKQSKPKASEPKPDPKAKTIRI
ncbi:MAG: hypothetical protein OHK0019_20660 [Saprospiraceae bacterium]